MPNFARWHGVADYKGYLSSSFKGTSRFAIWDAHAMLETLFLSLSLSDKLDSRLPLSMIGLRSSPCLYQTSFTTLWCCQVYEDSDTLDFLIIFFLRLKHPVTTVCVCFIYVCTKETSLWLETLLLFVLTVLICVGPVIFSSWLVWIELFSLLSRYGRLLRLLRMKVFRDHVTKIGHSKVC